MLFSLIILFIGIILTSFGLTNIIIYLNLFSLGYSFINYVNYIFRRWECLVLILGLLLIIVSFKKGRNL